eukprot:UN00452
MVKKLIVYYSIPLTNLKSPALTVLEFLPDALDQNAKLEFFKKLDFTLLLRPILFDEIVLVL